MTTPNVCIVDYGACNMGSLVRILKEITPRVTIESSPSNKEYSHYIIPGVGSFPYGMSKLISSGWDKCIREANAKNKFILGICLGMQLLSSHGDEDGGAEGLNLIPGRVSLLDLRPGETLPHVGWNSVEWQTESPLKKNIHQNADFYFVHSFAFNTVTPSSTLARTDYGPGFTSMVSNNKNIFGAQFHPEKSSKAGRQLLKNFIELC